MGDLVSVRTTKQEAYNQQVGISTRDVAGGFTSGGANAVTSSGGIASGQGSITAGGVAASNSTVNVQSLDPLALATTAGAVHDALASNVATSQGAIEGYQKALNIVAESAQAGQQANAQAGSLLGSIGVNPNQVIWIGGLALAAFAVIYLIRKRGK